MAGAKNAQQGGVERNVRKISRKHGDCGMWACGHAGGQTWGCRRRDKGRRQLGAWDVKLMSKAVHVYVHACVDVCAQARRMESRKRGWR